MRFKRWAIGITALITVILFIGCDDDRPVQGTIAPAFTLQSLTSATKSQADFYGKPLVLDFWATWCSPCKAAMPDVSHLALQFRDHVNVIGVSTESNSKVSDFWTHSGNKYATYLDPVGRAMNSFSVQSFPTMVVLDDHGVMQYEGSPPDLYKVRQILSKLIGENKSE